MIAAMAPLLAGCDEPHSASAATQQPSDPDVSIVTVKPQSRAMVRQLPGRIAPTRVSDVRPQVSGIIVARMFHQGSEVKAGEPLYQIDSRPFEVETQANEAALARADAVLEQASQMRAASPR
jgi:membrane fusion protein (multidrug efflux system)